jgi:hypothetical protein
MLSDIIQIILRYMLMSRLKAQFVVILGYFPGKDGYTTATAGGTADSVLLRAHPAEK